VFFFCRHSTPDGVSMRAFEVELFVCGLTLSSHSLSLSLSLFLSPSHLSNLSCELLLLFLLHLQKTFWSDNTLSQCLAPTQFSFWRLAYGIYVLHTHPHTDTDTDTFVSRYLYLCLCMRVCVGEYISVWREKFSLLSTLWQLFKQTKHTETTTQHATCNKS